MLELFPLKVYPFPLNSVFDSVYLQAYKQVYPFLKYDSHEDDLIPLIIRQV